MKPAITLEDLSVAYHKKPVLWDVDLSIPQGTLMGIVGPNGAGKSTLLKTILGTLKPITGTLEVPLNRYGQLDVAYVPQKESIDWDFPVTVYDVVMMGRYGHMGWFKKARQDDHDSVKKALEDVGMIEFVKTQIGALSGGQQQRVFLARALVQEAQIYLFDEPFQGIDAKTERAMIDLFKVLKEQGKTLVVVHHDLNTVEKYFDMVTLLNIRIVASGPVGEVFTEENIARTYQLDAVGSFWGRSHV